MGMLDNAPAPHVLDFEHGKAPLARGGWHERGVAPVQDEPVDVAHGALDARDCPTASPVGTHGLRGG